MRLITACSLIGNLSQADMYNMWVRYHHGPMCCGYAHDYWGYYVYCDCKIPANWFFPYEARYTRRCQISGIIKGAAPPNKR